VKTTTEKVDYLEARRARVERGEDENGLMSFERIAEILTERGTPISRANAWVVHNRALRKIRAALEAYK
jgi:hypothetical protein